MSNRLLQEFRQECKKYQQYLEEKDQLLKKLYLTQVKINGVHSIDTARPHTECKTENSVLIKIEAKDELLQELNEVNEKISKIEGAIHQIDYPFYRVVAWEKFVMNRSYQAIAKTYDVDSENLRKRVNQALLKAIDSDSKSIRRNTEKNTEYMAK